MFGYVKVICDTVDDYDGRDGDTKVLCLGGGAYSIPRNLVTGGDSRHVSVMEIDEGVTNVARKWFHLGEVEEQVGDRLTLITGDARVGMQDSDELYDVIINDTFAGNVPARTLSTKEAAELAKGHLTDKGIYVANVIGKATSDNPDMLAWETETLESVFKHVYVLNVDGASEESLANHIIVATDDDDYAIPSDAITEKVTSTAETRVLTDDDSPVEWIVSFNEKH